jgi:hypothetical protein
MVGARSVELFVNPASGAAHACPANRGRTTLVVVGTGAAGASGRGLCMKNGRRTGSSGDQPRGSAEQRANDPAARRRARQCSRHVVESVTIHLSILSRISSAIG